MSIMQLSVWFLLSVLCLLSGRAKAAVIGVDDRHGFNSLSFLGSGPRFEQFRQTILDAGHTIVPMSSFESVDLSDLDGLILSNGYTQNSSVYTATEQVAIQEFTANRGIFFSDRSWMADDDTSSMTPISFEDNKRLLENSIGFISRGGTIFAADVGGGTDIANFNQLTSIWGLEYSTITTDGDSREIQEFLINPITEGIDIIGIDGQFPISSFGLTTDLTLLDGQDDFIAFIPAPGVVVPFVLAPLIASRRRRG